MRVATRHYTSAVEAADRLDDLGDDDVDEAYKELFEVGVAAGELDVALAAGIRAVHMASSQVERARLLARVALCRAEGDGSFSHARVELETEIAMLGDDDVVAGSWYWSYLAGLCYRLGDNVGAETYAMAVLDEPAAPETAMPRALALMARHTMLVDRADPSRFEIGDAAIAAAEEAGDVDMLGAIHSNVGVALHYSGDCEGAIGHYRRAAEIADRRGDTSRLFYVRLNEAVLRSDQGRWAEARPTLDDLRRATQYDSIGYCHALSLRELGRLEVHAGRLEQGRSWLIEAKDWFASAGNRDERIEAEIALIECSLAEGRSDDVLAAEPNLVASIGNDALPHYLDGLIDHLVGSALLQRAEGREALARFDRGVAATADAYPFNHALLLVDKGKAEHALGRRRSAQRTREKADAILAAFRVEALPYVPPPR